MGGLRWGILGGSSRISRRAVAPAIEQSERGELVAVASRAADGSDAPYAELLARPDVDIVYVPLPNGLHLPWVAAALAAGKHVLCEKPLGMDAAEAEALFAAADDAGRILIEAYMTPFHPRTEAMVRILDAGALGEVRSMRAAFTFPLVEERPADHRFDVVLGGGSSLDVGIYCTAPMLRAAGREPVAVAASAVWEAPGCDRSLSAFYDFGDGLSGAITTSFELAPFQRLEFVGTTAALVADWAFNPAMRAATFDVVQLDGSTATSSFVGASAYLGMVEHVSAVVTDGAPPRHGREETLAVARTIDRARVAATG
jgi:D-xylose 1-dehydrogenase (NADP+, D-xylono-1,5-lactone-forming)